MSNVKNMGKYKTKALIFNYEHENYYIYQQKKLSVKSSEMISKLTYN